MSSNSQQYQRIEKAIAYIHNHFQEQPGLEELAHVAGFSPHHFQKIFKAWAGVSPKKFMQFLSLEYSKTRLRQEGASLLSAAYDTGLSGTGRLHDLYIKLEGMTPGEYKNGGEGLRIHYNFVSSPFGQVIVASTPKGVCHLFFDEDAQRALSDLKTRFPHARYTQQSDAFQQAACAIFQRDWRDLKQIKLHLAATPFQLKVWESLLKIPRGALTSYGQIAQDVGQPRAARAVGSAVGRNPVAFLIPCHRVIQSSGRRGNYMWGPARKTAMLGWEAASLLT